MMASRDAAALVALLGLGGPAARTAADNVEELGSAMAALERALAAPDGQPTLLPEDPEAKLAEARARIEAWTSQGFRMLTVLDDGYPANLGAVHDRPAVIFVAGSLVARDQRAVAVVGSRRASFEGRTTAGQIARQLVATGFTVVSGLAAGIDTAAHQAALDAQGRTLAVIGTGLAHNYPPENAALQRTIVRLGAVISQFWPETPPSRDTFPQRNAVMSGIAQATAVVEASPRSGARLQARLALAHGRPVFLMSSLLAQSWARELAARPGTHVVRTPAEITSTLERLTATDTLVE